MTAIAVFTDCPPERRMKLVRAVHAYFPDSAVALKKRLDRSDFLGLMDHALADPLAERRRDERLAKTLVAMDALGLDARLYRLRRDETVEDVEDLETRRIDGRWIREHLGTYAPELVRSPGSGGSPITDTPAAPRPFAVPELLDELGAWDGASPEERAAAVEVVAEAIAARFAFEGLRRFACAGRTHELGVFRHRLTGLQVHLLPGGRFEMGSSAAERALLRERGWSGDAPETPSAKVTVAPFLIARFPVTEGVWSRTGGGELHWTFGDDHPIDAVSRTELREWSAPLGLRLPSEAEWEYACRAGSPTIFYWGDAPDPRYAWMKENVPAGDDYTTFPERLHADRANAFGLVDMIGGLSEWVEDDLSAYPPSAAPYRDRRSSSPDGVQRGGCFMYGWNLTRSAVRIQCSDYGDTGMTGRIACSLELAAASSGLCAS
jgi:formylglycine-generating enzyme required for sulfatase activity